MGANRWDEARDYLTVSEDQERAQGAVSKAGHFLLGDVGLYFTPSSRIAVCAAEQSVLSATGWTVDGAAHSAKITSSREPETPGRENIAPDSLDGTAARDGTGISRWLAGRNGCGAAPAVSSSQG